MSTKKLAKSEFFLAENLRKLKKCLGLRQKVIAEHLGITSAYLSELMRGKKLNPSSELIDTICREFNITRDWLFSENKIFLAGKIPSNDSFKKLREEAGVTLAQLSKMSGYSIASISGLETNGIGSTRLKNKLTDILLSHHEDGSSAEVKHWRERALQAEEKLNSLKSVIIGEVKKF